MFEHSVKVPRLYKTAAKIAKKVHEDGGSIKGLVFQERHNIKALYALVAETLKYASQIDFLIKKSQLLIKEERLDPWLARILITELLWGKKTLSGESRPIKTILAYQQTFNAFSEDVHEQQQVARVNKPRYVRVNTIKLPINEAVEGFREEEWMLSKFFDSNDYNGYLQQISNLEDGQFMVDIHIKELLVFPSTMQFYRHEGYLNGMIILQDKASCLPVQILNPPKGSIVLDMCAAPGMKTTQLAALIENEGTVYAVERDVKRMETLNKLVESAGATCVKALNRDVLTITSNDIPGVEYILVDPSCSGSGIVNRVESDKSNGQQQPRLEKLAGFQIKILKHALKSFPDVKRVVYSTCSIYPQENEAVVKEVISQTSKFKLVSAKNLLNGPWLNYGSPDYGEVGSLCLYAKPEVDLTNGFFVAVFEKLEEGEENTMKVEKKLDSNNEENNGKPKRKKGYRVNIDMVNLEVQEENNEAKFDANNEENVPNEKSKKKKGYKVNIDMLKLPEASNNEETNMSIGKSKKKKGYKVNIDMVKLPEATVEGSKDDCETNRDESNQNEDKIEKRKKKKRREDEEQDSIDTNEITLDFTVDTVKKKKKKKHNIESQEFDGNNEETIINDQKIKKKKKKKVKCEEQENIEEVTDLISDNGVVKKKKSKRKDEVDCVTEEHIDKSHKKKKKK